MAALFIGVLFLGIVLPFPKAFDHTYQSAIVEKYDKLVSTQGPKIILVGGSSVTYGIKEQQLEELTERPVVSLGLYGGLGDLFQTELALANIDPGDLVVLAYEYNWIDTDAFTTIPADMVMSGIGSRLSLYRYIPANQWVPIVGYLFPYAEKKLEYVKNPGEDHHHTMFDGEGRLTEVREESLVLDYETNAEIQNPIDYTDKTVSEETVAYLKKFVKRVERKGGTVVLTAPPLLDQAAVCDPSEFTRVYKDAGEQIGIAVISDPAAYIFPAELMYDTVYHCNDKGAEMRTKLLATDLEKVQ